MIVAERVSFSGHERFPGARFRLSVQRAETFISKKNITWAQYVQQASSRPDQEKNGG